MGLLPARVMARAPLGPALQAAVNYFLWLMAFDDLACDETDPGRQSSDDHILLLCDLARIAEAPAGVVPSNPFAAALFDLRRQLDQTATPVQVARWAAATQAYLLANAAVVIQRATGKIADLNTYAALRLHSGAMKPTLMLLDMASSYELSPAQMEHSDIRALNEMVCTIVGWDNDLLTYQKEIARGGADHNLITILSNARGSSAAEAVTEAISMRDRVLCLFLGLRDQVLPEASPELRCYLADLSSWIPSHLDWGLTTTRYSNPEDPADLPRHFTDTPQDGSLEPLPLPSIAWWWGQLIR